MVQEKISAEFQFSIFVSASLAVLVQTNFEGIFWDEISLLFQTSLAAEESEPSTSIMGQEIIETFDLSSWRRQKSARF